MLIIISADGSETATVPRCEPSSAITGFTGFRADRPREPTLCAEIGHRGDIKFSEVFEPSITGSGSQPGGRRRLQRHPSIGVVLYPPRMAAVGGKRTFAPSNRQLAGSTASRARISRFLPLPGTAEGVILITQRRETGDVGSIA